MAESQPEVRILVVYYSRFGVVRSIAEHVAEGAGRVEGVQADLLDVEDPLDAGRSGTQSAGAAPRPRAQLDRLADADALIIGAPAYFGSMASPLKHFFEESLPSTVPSEQPPSRPWHLTPFRGKVGAAFTASATPHGGNEQAIHSMLTLMMHLGMVIVTPGQQAPILENVSAAYGATAVSGPSGDRPLDDETIVSARRLGQQVAEVTLCLHWGRQEWDRRRRAALQAKSRPPGPFDPSA